MPLYASFCESSDFIDNRKYSGSVMVAKLMHEYTKWGLKINLQKTECLCAGETEDDMVLDCEIIRH